MPRHRCPGACVPRPVSRARRQPGEAQRISAGAWVLGHIREPLCRPAALTAGLLPLCHRVQGPSLLTAVVGWLTRSLSRLSPGATQGPSLGRSRCPSHVCFPPATCWLHVGVACSRRRVFPCREQVRGSAESGRSAGLGPESPCRRPGTTGQVPTASPGLVLVLDRARRLFLCAADTRYVSP